MMEVAQRSSDPTVLALASCHSASHHLNQGDSMAAQMCAEQGMALTEEFGVPSFSAVATFYLGAALVAQRRYEEGITGMRRGISAFRATGGTLRAWEFYLLASGLGKAGRPEEGLQVLEEGFVSVSKTGEQFGSTFLHRAKGQLLLAQNPLDVEAESCFRTAIEIARRQSARSAELSATTSLARLLRDTGRGDEARTMLAEIYNWFTEGFDTADLKDARALLDELGS
jgi:predicted ATPase